MFEVSTLLTYLLACGAIVLAPGPAQVLVLARTVNDGRRSGLLTGVGLNTGTIFHAVAAAFGLSAILMTSAIAFSVVKYLGAAYLIYLGIKALINKDVQQSTASKETLSAGQAFVKSFLIGVLNPKVALFFLAFLPQFVDESQGYVFWQFLALGLILAALDVVYESVLVLTIGFFGKSLTENRRIAIWRERFTGLVLLGLGIRLALTERE